MRSKHFDVANTFCGGQVEKNSARALQQSKCIGDIASLLDGIEYDLGNYDHWQLLRLSANHVDVENPTRNLEVRPESVSQQAQIAKFDKRPLQLFLCPTSNRKPALFPVSHAGRCQQKRTAHQERRGASSAVRSGFASAKEVEGQAVTPAAQHVISQHVVPICRVPVLRGQKKS